jgi:hypothetical protein
MWNVHASDAHVERVHASDAHMGEQLALIVPVDMGLRARHHFEPAVQTRQRVVVTISELGSDRRPHISEEHFDPLIITGEAVLGDQPLMNHGRFQGQIGSSDLSMATGHRGGRVDRG